MKVILYMAISADGFIAKKNGDSDWTKDFTLFKQKVSEMGCIVVGRKTFDQFHSGLYPVKGVTNIVVTANNPKINEQENVVLVHSPYEAIKIASEKGHEQILLVGGGKTNGSFLKAGLIAEIILIVHPLILGDGIKLFEAREVQVNLELLDTKQLQEGLVQLHYKVLK